MIGLPFHTHAGWLALLVGIIASGVSAPGASPAPTPRRTATWVRLEVQPTTVGLRGPNDEHGLLVSAVDDRGRVRDVTSAATFRSSGPGLVSVSTNGVCRPVADGAANIVVSYAGMRVPVLVTVTNTLERRPPSFRQDIEPILTRAGCNMGSCHGKLAGQNGFRLSLRGYAPELDIDWLRQDVSGRRIDPAVPEESLLVLKSLADVPHEGRQRFEAGSRSHKLLLEWIAARAPGPLPAAEEPDPVRLEILPGDRVLAPGDRQPLLVRAFYPDGHARDVTWLAQFSSNDEATASVTPTGRVTGRRAGETTVRAHFQGLVAVARFTLPFPNVVEDSRFARPENAIDDAVFARLKALNLPPSARCSDEAFLRRVMLDTIGTLPTAEEVREFLEDSGPDRRVRLVETLFDRPEFVDYWTLQFADLLQNRKERDHDVRGTKGVRAFHSWLRGQVAANRPWDELARDLITATGDAVQRPEIGYYITTVGEKTPAESEVVDSVAQAFLGTRIGCARCHNHPLERYTQDDFYHFAAFFSRVTVDRKELEKGVTEVVSMSREEKDRRRELEEIGRKLKEAESKLVREEGSDLEALRNEFMGKQREFAEHKRRVERARTRPPVTVQPRTRQELAARPLDRSELRWQPGEDPRSAFAAWLTSPTNEAFSGAMINRLWKHFLGTGLVEPVDDLRASNPPSNPALWQLLNREFVASGFNVRHLMRLIVNSGAYQLSSETVAGNETDTRFYSHYYARRLPAEVMLDALSKATGVPETFAGHPVGVRAIQLSEPHLSNYFLSLFGRSERVTACACERNGEVTLPQLLHLQNGEDTVRKIQDPRSRLKKLVSWKASGEEIVEDLYLASLGRRPRPEELKRVLEAFRDATPEEAGADLFWALLNSKEFAFNH